MKPHRERRMLRTLQWDAQLERSGELYYRTVSRLTRDPNRREAFERFADLEAENARALREELRRAGGHVRPNLRLAYASVFAGITAPLLPRTVVDEMGEQILSTLPVFWRDRARVYGRERRDLIRSIRNRHEEQRRWFAERVAANEH